MKLFFIANSSPINQEESSPTDGELNIFLGIIIIINNKNKSDFFHSNLTWEKKLLILVFINLKFRRIFLDTF